MRKYPPFKPSGFTPGFMYRVVRPFTSDVSAFEENEVLMFEGEGYIPEEECDVWRFTLPESHRVKAVVGRGDHANPTAWRQCFEKVAGAEKATRPVRLDKIISRA
jgi:hypothetical protein